MHQEIAIIGSVAIGSVNPATVNAETAAESTLMAAQCIALDWRF